MSIGFTNTTNSTHCSVPFPVNNPFRITLGSSTPPAYLIESVEEDTYKPVFKITTDGIRTLPYQPFFDAFLTGLPDANIVPVGPLRALVSDAVISNTGEHYNATSGEFTAPVSGIYHFEATLRLTTKEPFQSNPAPRGTVAMFITVGSHTYESSHINPWVQRLITSNLAHADLKGSCTGFMEANQTARAAYRVFEDSSMRVDVLAGQLSGSPSIYASFSGYLVG